MKSLASKLGSLALLGATLTLNGCCVVMSGGECLWNCIKPEKPEGNTSIQSTNPVNCATLEQNIYRTNDFSRVEKTEYSQEIRAGLDSENRYLP